MTFTPDPHTLHPVLVSVTETIVKRSLRSRTAYLVRMQEAANSGFPRQQLSCGNLAHGFAACSTEDKNRIRVNNNINIGIVTAYNDMLSAHRPFEHYPEIIRRALNAVGCTAQVAGGVPAMCDGVTQGLPGMELSLFSRDQIAMSTAIALSHTMFDGVLCLGVCDKIVPGLLIGALRFGHLPVVFVPAGPMMSGLPNDEKSKVRQAYAQGKVSRDALLEVEAKSYHSPGTCTFYGTANTNQMLLEFMGLQLPGSSFVNPDSPLREPLTIKSAQLVTELVRSSSHYRPIATILDEKAIVNGIVGLLASGGSTNLTIHLIAIARAAGIQIDWHDMAELSKVVPLLARVYPNGGADVNHFHAAGGIGFLIRELLSSGLLHGDTQTVVGQGLQHYVDEPFLDTTKNNELLWVSGEEHSKDESVLRPVSRPFQMEGGIQLLQGNLGNGIVKVAAVKPEHRYIEAPAVVFVSQEEMTKAFEAGQLDKDCVVVIRYQGPKANGMPELHQLTPALSVLLEKGFKIALVTDGRMSGASGKVPAAIHVCPEALEHGAIAKIQDGDLIRLDVTRGTLELLVNNAELTARQIEPVSLKANQWGTGRELFSLMRNSVSSAQTGATIFRFEHEE